MKKFILMQDMVGQMQEQLERMDCMKKLSVKNSTIFNKLFK